MSRKKTPATITAEIVFMPTENGPRNLISEAEIRFTGGILDGARLVGFSLWRTEKGDPVVTVPSFFVPSRSWGGPTERRFFDLFRDHIAGSQKATKAAIVAAWKEHGNA